MKFKDTFFGLFLLPLPSGEALLNQILSPHPYSETFHFPECTELPDPVICSVSLERLLQKVCKAAQLQSMC